MRQHRPIRRHDVKKLSIIRNPGTGPLLERLREKPMTGPIGFHSARPFITGSDELDAAYVRKLTGRDR